MISDSMPLIFLIFLAKIATWQNLFVQIHDFCTHDEYVEKFNSFYFNLSHFKRLRMNVLKVIQLMNWVT